MIKDYTCIFMLCVEITITVLLVLK